MIRMQVTPDIYPLLIERLIVARPDLLKADVREVRISTAHGHFAATRMQCSVVGRQLFA